MANAIRGLENFLARTQLNSTDNEVTLGEAQEFIRGAFDTNSDGRIDNLDRFDTNGNGVIDTGDDPVRTQILREMAYVDLRSINDPALRARLIQAQDALRLALRQSSPIVPPPPINSTNPLFNDVLIRDPYNLSDDRENQRWSNMRQGFEGRTITINRDEARRVITNIIGELRRSNPSATVTNQTDAIVFNLWRNEDYVDGERRQVFRVEEMKGVLDYINSLPEDKREEFKRAFKKSMADYVKNSANNLDQQFVMDSMMQILGSTDFSGDPQGEELKSFIKEVAIGLAKNSDFFKNKIPALGSDRVVLGNYDGTKDMGIFSSMALVRNANGTYTFIEHQTAPPTNRTRYVFEGGAPPGGFAPGPSSSTTTLPSTTPPRTTTSPSTTPPRTTTPPSSSTPPATSSNRRGPGYSSSGVLPWDQSGPLNTRYPESHSTFTDNTQDNPSRGGDPAPSEYLDSRNGYSNYCRYLRGLGSDYTRSPYGSEYFNLFGNEIAQGRSVEDAALRVTEALNSRTYSRHRPLARISPTSTMNQTRIGYEVLIFTGATETWATIDTYTIRHAFERGFPGRSNVTEVSNPTRNQLDTAVAELAQRARRTGRTPVIIYNGHSTRILSRGSSRLQGSDTLLFNNGMDENDYKRILRRHLGDTETISIFSSCYCGAAVTAIDPEELRRYFASLA